MRYLWHLFLCLSRSVSLRTSAVSTYRAKNKGLGVTVPSILTAICIVCFAPVLIGQGSARKHFSEVDRYHEALPGDWAASYFISFAPRYVTISDVSGFDDTLAPRFGPGMSFLAARFENQLDYILDNDFSLAFRPSIGLGYGLNTYSSHGEFKFASIGGIQDVPAKFAVDQFTWDVGTQAGLRWDFAELFLDYRWLNAHRFRRITASSSSFSNQNGFVDNLESQIREEDDLFTAQDWGIGLGYHIDDRSWNYRTALIFRPATHIEFKGRSTTLTGFGLDFRADGLQLSDDVGLALSFRWDFWLPNDDFNDVFFFELGFGIRFS